MEFAIINTGGKQYKVSKGDTLKIEKIKGDFKVGDKIVFDKVLLVEDGKDTTIGTPYIKEAKVEALVDSELLERQINGYYKVLDSNIQPLFLELWNLKIDFGDVKFKHVAREKNREADRMANAALDKEMRLQLFGKPKAMLIASGALGLFAIVPGLPTIPFLILGFDWVGGICNAARREAPSG